MTGWQITGLVLSIIVFLVVLTFFVMAVVALGFWLANDSQKTSDDILNEGWMGEIEIINNTSNAYILVNGGINGTSVEGNQVNPGQILTTGGSSSSITYELTVGELSDPDNGKVVYGYVMLGPLKGVYVNRGSMSAQTITLTSQVYDAKRIQDNNQGGYVIPVDGFQKGGKITLTYTGSL